MNRHRWLGDKGVNQWKVPLEQRRIGYSLPHVYATMQNGEQNHQTTSKNDEGRGNEG
jgi:hypothetical protein